MFSRATKIRLAVAMLIAVVGIGYTGARYAGLDRVLGTSGYVVTTEMADAGGVFTNADVTYRGVSVGRVSGMRLTHSGIEVDLHIDSSAPRIPSDTRAVVANRSAVGEQYVDLRPDDARGPYLDSGSVIPSSRTETPPPPESLLVNLDRLVTSIPTDSMRTVVDEAGAAFQGTGPHLRRMLDDTNMLLRSADQHLPQTKGLLANSDVVLRTQQGQSENLATFSTGLRDISSQLKQSDPDLRRLIANAPGASRELNEFLRTTKGDIGVLSANLLTTLRITNLRLPGIENMLVGLPIMTALNHSAQDGDGRGHLGAVLNFFNPLACERGYEGTNRRPGSDTTPAPTNRDFECAEPPDSPINPRGSRNVPQPPVPEPVAPPPRNAVPLPLPPR